MTDSDPDSITISNRSGGADLNAGRDLTIGGDVVGRDKITSTTILTGDQQYDVHGLANPYLGLQSFTYADHAKYAGREKLIADTVTRLTAPEDPLARGDPVGQQLRQNQPEPVRAVSAATRPDDSA